MRVAHHIPHNGGTEGEIIVPQGPPIRKNQLKSETTLMRARKSSSDDRPGPGICDSKYGKDERPRGATGFGTESQ